MTLLKCVCIGILLTFVYACSHPIEIAGEGDVSSASGTRGCLLEEFQAELERKLAESQVQLKEEES